MGFQIIDCRRLSWWFWLQTKRSQSVVCTVRIGAKRVSKLNVDIEGDGDVVIVFHPMRTIHGNMNTISSAQCIGCSAALKLGLVLWGIVVNGPKPFDLFFRKNLSICAVEDVDRLRSFDLQQETAFAIDMIRRDTFWRGNEDERIFTFDLGFQVLADLPFDLLPANAEKALVDRIILNVFE